MMIAVRLLTSLFLLFLLTARPRPAAAAIADHGLPRPERHDARWEWLDLWPRLLHIRRQFDRDGYPLRNGDARANSPKHGEVSVFGVA